MTLPEIISSPTFTWLPPVIISAFIFIGALIGFMNGWKTALYFLCANIIGLIIGVFTFSIFWEKIQSPINNLLPKDMDLSEVVKITQSPLMAIYAFLVMFVTTILSLIPYIFVRKFLKKSMKENKKAEKSNLVARSLGSGVAILSVAPYASFMASTSTVISPPGTFADMTDTLTGAFTFGKAKTISKDYDDAIALFDLTNPDSIEEVKNIFESFITKPGEKPQSEQVIVDKMKKKRKQIQAIVNRPIMVSKFIKGMGEKGKDLSKKIQDIKTEKQKDNAVSKMQKANIVINKETFNKLLQQFSK